MRSIIFICWFWTSSLPMFLSLEQRQQVRQREIAARELETRRDASARIIQRWYRFWSVKRKAIKAVAKGGKKKSGSKKGKKGKK